MSCQIQSVRPRLGSSATASLELHVLSLANLVFGGYDQHINVNLKLNSNCEKSKMGASRRSEFPKASEQDAVQRNRAAAPIERRSITGAQWAWAAMSTVVLLG